MDEFEFNQAGWPEQDSEKPEDEVSDEVRSLRERLRHLASACAAWRPW